MFDVPFADTQCGAKVMTGALARRAVPLLSSRDFLFDVDLLLTARSLGYVVDEVPTVWVDQAGSKLDALRDARRMAASAVRLWLHHRVIPVDHDPMDPAARNGDGAEVIDLAGHQWAPDEDQAERADDELVGA